MTGAKSKTGASKSNSKLAVKKGAAKMSKAAKKAAKDPNMPKRPASAFFVFMEDFRKQYKEEHPDNKSVAAVGKAGGEKWKSMSDEEKAPFVAKADKRKTEYAKNVEAYKKKLNGEPDAADEEEEIAENADSDKSKSEIHDDDDDGDDDGEDSDED